MTTTMISQFPAQPWTEALLLVVVVMQDDGDDSLRSFGALQYGTTAILYSSSTVPYFTMAMLRASRLHAARREQHKALFHSDYDGPFPMTAIHASIARLFSSSSLNTGD